MFNFFLRVVGILGSGAILITLQKQHIGSDK